jgi:hypothetical protein
MPGLALLAIAGGLLAALLFQRWSAQSGSGSALRKLALVVGGLLLMFLLLRSGSALLAFLGLLFPIVFRSLQWWLRMRSAAGIFNDSKPDAAQNQDSRSERQSTIETRFLRMTLHHSSGVMQGTVLDGVFQGRKLEELDITLLIELWKECQADAQSLAVLEAYLDRTQPPDWREKVKANKQDRADQSGRGSSMDAQEAYAILGLQPDATQHEIKMAHRRLMQKFHPDHGGSDYLAARINQAKELLLSG